MTKSELCAGYHKRFPNLPTRTLAKKIYDENKLMFSNFDSCRSALRYVRDEKGELLRGYKSKYKVDASSKIRIEDLPQECGDSYERYYIKNSKVLIISDLHFPYQDNKAIAAALNKGLEENVNCVFINGDLLDFAQISRHERDWRQRTVYEEFEAVRQFLQLLRKKFPKATIVFKEGNHDERWEKWLFLKAPEIFDDPEFKLETRLRLGELGIDIVKDKRPVQIGKLTCLHGHEFIGGGSGGVNPARSTFLKTLDSVVVGHYHKSSQHIETTMNGNTISVTSLGSLCNLNPHYARINKWNHGFAIVDHDIKTGEYQLTNYKIINGKIYI